MVKTDEIQKGWRQSMDLLREQSKIIHTSREIIADYQDHLSVCLTKSIDECIICRDLFNSLENSLLVNCGNHTLASKQNVIIQNNLIKLFKTEKLCISIFFDNPQLSKTVSMQEGMEVILETFVTKTMVKLVFGRVVFSGEFDPTVILVDSTKVRGGDVVVLEVIELICADLSKFPARIVDGIKELQLRGINSPDIQRITGDISFQDVEAFFGPCTGRVDVILDPIQHDNYKFYPYYEGTRKMAPQFRSKGVGYVRLGDDMSNFGTAFLSVDHGRTFLDRGANDRNIMSNSYDPVDHDNRAGTAASNQSMSSTTRTTEPQGHRMATMMRTNSEFSRSMPQMNKNGSSQPLLPPPTVYAPVVSTVSPPLMIRASSAGTCDGSVASYSTVPNSSISMMSPSPSPLPSSQKKKLTESLRRMINVNRSHGELSLNVPDAHLIDTSYDDEDGTASCGLPTPKQLHPSSPTAQQLEEAISAFEASLLQEGSNAWRTKIEVVKHLQSDFELASVPIAEAVRSSTVLRLLDGLREQLCRTQNPQLTVSLLELLPVLASRLKVYLNADSAVQLSWRRVVTEMIQLLRNSNRQIEMAASRFMMTISQVGPRALSWSLLCELLELVVGLPIYSSVTGNTTGAALGSTAASSKVASSASGSSGPKAVGKLNKVVEFVEQWLMREIPSLTQFTGSGMFTTEELFRLTRVALVAVKDRDEKTRTSGLQLLAVIAVSETMLSNPGGAVSSQLSAGLPSWLQVELDRANLPRNKLNPFIARAVDSLSVGINSIPVTDTSQVTEVPFESTSSGGKLSSGTYKSRKLTPTSSIRIANNGSNPQPPNMNNVVGEKLTHSQEAPLGRKMMQLRLQEAQLLLKREPQSAAEWIGVQEVIDMADVACNEVEQMSKKHHVPLGTLLRVLLPFTEQTSTLDQTISVVGGDWKAQLQQDLHSQIPQLISLQAELLSYSQTLRKLRGLVRVKIADQSDFRQARAAVHTLKDFLHEYVVSFEP